MSKLLTAFLAGLAVGILLAPEKGSAIRERITDWLDDSADEVKNAVDRAGDVAGSLESRIKKAIK